MPKLLIAGVACVMAAGCAPGPDPDPRGWEAYERYLGAIDLARSADPVDVANIRRLLNDPEPLARDGAVVALGRVGWREDVPRIIEMVFEKVEKDGQIRNTPLVRADACRVLSRLGDSSVVGPLAGALKGDTSAEVRRTAAWALGAFPREAGAKKALVEALADRSAAVVYSAHATLCMISGRSDLPRDPGSWQEWLRQSSAP